MTIRDDAVTQLVLANRILANEGVFDSFGHVTVRDPEHPGRYLMARSRSPDQVEADDIIAFTLASQPVDPAIKVPFGERVIHGSIYAARPDVNAVCHHHARAVLPFCISGVALVPVDHVGASIGAIVPFWNQHDEFGDTDMIVGTPEQGASLARALGPHWVVLMRHHGATVAGRSLQELVFRAIHCCRNAELQQQAAALGSLGAMTPGEIEKAGAFNLTERPMLRAWSYWARRTTNAT